MGSAPFIQLLRHSGVFVKLMILRYTEDIPPDHLQHSLLQRCRFDKGGGRVKNPHGGHLFG